MTANISDCGARRVTSALGHKRTFPGVVEMSAKCHKRTSAAYSIISSAICWNAAVITAPVYARDTYCYLGFLWRKPMRALAKAFPRTYARPALRKAFAAFPADTKVA